MQNRIIKFRAWDKSNAGEMFEVLGVDFNDLEVSYTVEGIRKEGKKGVDWNDLIDVELMQFTGLTDKKGKKIYEGDIVRFVNQEEKYDKNHVIEWKHNGFVVNGWTLHLEHEGTVYEVIGNIYENPELIK
jgi:uncharacterized phage protein (TIGR01671 family)